MGWGLFFGLLCFGISVETGLREIAKSISERKER